MPTSEGSADIVELRHAWSAYPEDSIGCIERGKFIAILDEITSLHTAAQALLDKLELVRDASDGAFQIAAMHGCEYAGPNYGAEADALRAVLHPST
jgi:hypothetical protein